MLEVGLSLWKNSFFPFFILERNYKREDMSHMTQHNIGQYSFVGPTHVDRTISLSNDYQSSLLSHVLARLLAG